MHLYKVNKANDLNTNIMKAGSKVAKNAGSNQYYTGTVTEMTEQKALVYFPSRGFSRWCNISNLELVD